MATADPYLKHREAIERAIAFVCRRQRLTRAEAEEFSSDVHFHLFENNAAALRAFNGRSSIQTFLIAVAIHRFQDWRNAKWGKWRPSAEARRLGPTAVMLETYLVRDRLSMNEAVETLRTNHQVAESREALEQIAARFPVRPGRSFVGEEFLAERPAATSAADAGLDVERAQMAASRASAALDVALRALPAADRLILRLRYDDDVPVSKIARALRLEQKPLYPRIGRLLADLRRTLEAAGIQAEDIRQVLKFRGFDHVDAHGERNLSLVSVHLGEGRPRRPDEDPAFRGKDEDAR